MHEKVLILDFGSQYTQLIARRVRELNVYCEILPFNNFQIDEDVKCIILSGSPFSVLDENAPEVDIKEITSKYPTLAVCYGAQMIAHKLGGEVGRARHSEYGKALLEKTKDDPIFENISFPSQVWMSHGDTILKIPKDYYLLASSDSIEVACFKAIDKPVYCLQFHPEVTHTLDGSKVLYNFLVGVCQLKQNWTEEAYIQTTVESIKEQVGDQQVFMALSGGVDSTVAAHLIDKAIGKNLHCLFVDNGLLRKNEYSQVLDSYEHSGLNIRGIDAKSYFYEKLKGKTEPEEKRKAIGNAFIEIFDIEARKVNCKFLGQGTIYPDVIESISVHGPSAVIKSHHNVGGLPDEMEMDLVEPLRFLFKDEVRRVGKVLDIDQDILNRHPFPGPGLGIRILGDITEEKVNLLQEVDDIFISNLKKHNFYNQIWQALAVLLPVKSVGVMGDERTYENVVVLRAVESKDGMTAEWSHLPHSFLATISNEIINKVKGVNRVVYDISTKPPSTIEWE